MNYWKKTDLCSCTQGDDHGGEHVPFWRRPGLSRRELFKLAGTGLAGYYFAPFSPVPSVIGQAKVQTKNTAKNCIFILLTGAPSHVDTFDLKEGAWTPATFNPTTYGDLRFPQGLMPTLATQINRFAVSAVCEPGPWCTP